jgi:hypothetical protein
MLSVPPANLGLQDAATKAVRAQSARHETTQHSGVGDVRGRPAAAAAGTGYVVVGYRASQFVRHCLRANIVRLGSWSN